METILQQNHVQIFLKYLLGIKRIKETDQKKSQRSTGTVLPFNLRVLKNNVIFVAKQQPYVYMLYKGIYIKQIDIEIFDYFYTCVYKYI